MKKYIAAIVLFLTVFIATCGYNRVDTLTYAVYPYIPDAEYYQEIIERRWAEIEPNIKLVRAEWNCYHDGVPDGIDVIMYDAVMRDALIEDGWIRPIDPGKGLHGLPGRPPGAGSLQTGIQQRFNVH